MLHAVEGVVGVVVQVEAASSGNAQSTSSIATPSSAPIAGGISSSRRSTGCSGPSSCPEAMRNTRL